MLKLSWTHAEIYYSKKLFIKWMLHCSTCFTLTCSSSWDRVLQCHSQPYGIDFGSSVTKNVLTEQEKDYLKSTDKDNKSETVGKKNPET